MDYDEALRWLYRRQALGIKLGLDKVHRLLAAVGDPQRAFKAVHVAGTNGKGTVTRLLGDILHRAGRRVGTFTSPHLVHFTERITLDGDDISRDAVAAGLTCLRPAVEALDGDGEPPTFFEVNTALAFLAFQEAGMEWAVIETGMGGRLDATNVVEPELTIITNIGLDHQPFLGESLADITFEKAGIMKPGVPCITAAQGEALVALKAVSRDRKIPMSIVGEDYVTRPDINGFRLVHPQGEAQYDLALVGPHQITNAAIVVAAVDALRTHVEIPARAVADTLRTFQMPGRLERLEHVDGNVRREVVLDGAHNPAAAQALRYHLGQADWSGFDLICGFNKDKDWRQLLDQWMPLAAVVRAVPLRTGARSLDPAKIVAAAEAEGFIAEAYPDVEHALAASGQRVLVAGSIYLVGEARAVILGLGLEEVDGAR